MRLLIAVFLTVNALSAQTSIFNIVSSPSINPIGNTLNAVAAASPTDAWAVGFQNDNQLNGSRTLTQHWDGTQWTVVASPNPGSTPACKNQNTGNMLNAAAAVSPGDAWAVGFSFTCSADLKPLILHWNGVKWAAVPSPALRTNGNSALNGIKAFGANNIYAVGYQPAANGAVQTLVEHWDGQIWTVLPTPNGNLTGSPLYAISGTSPNDIWVVGALVSPNNPVLTLTEHFDGTKWTVVPSPSPVGGSELNQNVLTSVIANSPADVTAIGYIRFNFTQFTLIEHWNGTAWSVVASPNQSTASGAVNLLQGVSGFSGSDLYACGFYLNSATGGEPQTLMEHFDGVRWKIIPTPTEGLDQHLNGIFALPGSTSVWSVGAFSFNAFNPEAGLLQLPQTLVTFSPIG